ncbi:glycoside hydrolase superfamily [Dichotomocladium elegans]|nr:glycoside hydrolase superfamily [Dichotomocladium elegans]
MVDRFSRNGVQSIRTYSQECEVLPKLLKAVRGTGITVTAGVWLDGNDRRADQAKLTSLIHTLQGMDDASASLVSAVLVGNECIQEGKLDADTLVSYISQVKKAIGGRYRVGTADTPAGYSSSNGALLDASDIVYLNIHPFFGGVSASGAVANVKSQLAAFQAKTSKQVVIGEIGWPSQGEPNHHAVPGLREMSTVFRGLVASHLKYHFFESHDSAWKAPGTYGIEPHWGLVDRNGKSKIPEFI